MSDRASVRLPDRYSEDFWASRDFKYAVNTVYEHYRSDDYDLDAVDLHHTPKGNAIGEYMGRLGDSVPYLGVDCDEKRGAVAVHEMAHDVFNELMPDEIWDEYDEMTVLAAKEAFSYLNMYFFAEEYGLDDSKHVFTSELVGNSLYNNKQGFWSTVAESLDKEKLKDTENRFEELYQFQDVSDDWHHIADLAYDLAWTDPEAGEIYLDGTLVEDPTLQENMFVRDLPIQDVIEHKRVIASLAGFRAYMGTEEFETQFGATPEDRLIDIFREPMSTYVTNGSEPGFEPQSTNPVEDLVVDSMTAYLQDQPRYQNAFEGLYEDESLGEALEELDDVVEDIIRENPERAVESMFEYHLEGLSGCIDEHWELLEGGDVLTTIRDNISGARYGNNPSFRSQKRYHSIDIPHKLGRKSAKKFVQNDIKPEFLLNNPRAFLEGMDEEIDEGILRSIPRSNGKDVENVLVGARNTYRTTT